MCDGRVACALFGRHRSRSYKTRFRNRPGVLGKPAGNRPETGINAWTLPRPNDPAALKARVKLENGPPIFVPESAPQIPGEGGWGGWRGGGDHKIENVLNILFAGL